MEKALSPFEQVLDWLQNTDMPVFLTGAAGTGKTTFLHKLRENPPKPMVVLAPTGVAAINAGGKTIHSFFQIPPGLYLPSDTKEAKVNIRKEKRDLIKRVELVVIDEISMVRADLLDMVDSRLRKFKNSELPFGGAQLLMIGDLEQLPPIVKEEERQFIKTTYASPYFFDSIALRKSGFVCVELKEVFRQSDLEFIEILNQIRCKNLSSHTVECLQKRYIPNFTPAENEKYITLTTHHYQADNINKKRLDLLNGKEMAYTAEVEGDFPNSIFPTQEKLYLKEGAQVMFLKNDPSAEKSYFNGKIGVVKSLKKDSVCVESDGELIEVKALVWENNKYEINSKTNDINTVVAGYFKQIPLKTAWAITIHKSQGLTFDKVVIDIGKAFAPGQVYVALSRCRTLDGVVLSNEVNSSLLPKDLSIEKFNSEIKNLAHSDLDRENFKEAYRLRMLREQFDFSSICKSLEELINLGKTFPSNYMRLQEDMADVSKLIYNDIFVAGKKLISTIDNDVKPQKELVFTINNDVKPQINDEIIKTEAYRFLQILEKELLPLLPRLKVELPFETQKKLLKISKELNRDFKIKQRTLEACADAKFDTLKYQQAKSEAVINLKA